MHRISSVVRYVWAAPTTALGLVVVLTGLWRAQVWVVDGVVEAHGPALAWLLSHFTLMPGGAAALTLGHVVIARDRWSLESTRAHERVHVRQCERCGPLFVPAYLRSQSFGDLARWQFLLRQPVRDRSFQCGSKRATRLSAASPLEPPCAPKTCAATALGRFERTRVNEGSVGGRETSKRTIDGTAFLRVVGGKCSMAANAAILTEASGFLEGASKDPGVHFAKSFAAEPWQLLHHGARPDLDDAGVVREDGAPF